MEFLFAPLLFVVLLFIGPFVALNAYLLVWLCGPAIRRAGRMWEEGQLQAWESSGRRRENKMLWARFGTIERRTPVPANTQVKPAVGAENTRPLDGGHRWLAGGGKKSA